MFISKVKSNSNGGLLIYIDKRFDYEIKMEINMYEQWERQIIQITGGGLSQSVTIGNICRPPRPSIENYNEFINEFQCSCQICRVTKTTVLSSQGTII